MADSLRPDALDPEDETIPVSPGRRRFQITVGLLIVAAILIAFIWFGTTHTDTDDGTGMPGITSPG